VLQRRRFSPEEPGESQEEGQEHPGQDDSDTELHATRGVEWRKGDLVAQDGGATEEARGENEEADEGVNGRHVAHLFGMGSVRYGVRPYILYILCSRARTGAHGGSGFPPD